MSHAAPPRVTIGLPVYNGTRYLREALDSILAQTFTAFEVVISDNASTDETPEICRAYAARDPRIRYVRHPHNVGANANFNGVVAHATAPYFKWASCDDRIAPDLLERCVGVLDRDATVILAHSGTTFIGPGGEPIDREDGRLHLMSGSPAQRFRALLDNLQYCNAVYGVIRTNVLRSTPLFADFVGSDICFLAELSLHGKFHELPEPLLFRRLHEEAASNLAPHDLLNHYAIGQGRLVLYYWTQIGEQIRAALRSPIALREKAKVIAFLARRAVWQRSELTTEIGFLLRHLTGRPYKPLSIIPRGRSKPGSTT